MAYRSIIDCETGAESLVEVPDDTPAPAVPESVSPRQIKLALLAANLLDTIDTFVATQPKAVQISWEYATEFRRDDALLNQMGTAFGMSSAQVDDLFRTAATL